MRPITLNRVVGPWMAVLLTVLAAVPRVSMADGPEADPGEAEHFFETRIRPVLVERCLKCHGPEEQKSDLRLDSREAVLKGGLLGPAVEPGDPELSLLIDAVAHTDDFLKMPPGNEKLSEEVVRDLTEWVRMGAPWPETSASTAAQDTEAATHWAFRPIRKPEPPVEGGAAGAENPIDAFLLARLDAAGLTPSPEADRRTLIRRLSFDLTGLPPTPGEIQAFLDDDSPEAYARFVDRLLASPAYGERWGRHWLDVARYADTKGYVFQEERRYPYAYTYRDYVIEAFNEDKPYDRFLVEQLAADLIPDGDPGDLAALGFLTVGRRFLNKQDDIIDDRIDVTSRGLLGLTVACARCHDHKYDPIPAEDYYSLYGVFASSEEPDDPPLIDPEAAGSDDYRADRQDRLEEVSDYLASKREEFAGELATRIADYLTAAAELGPDPSRDQVDTTARQHELRPNLLRLVHQRWQALTGPAASSSDPLLGPWKALAALPDDESFAAEAGAIVESLRAEIASGPADPARSLASDALLGEGPPGSMVELAGRYGALLARAIEETSNADLQPIRDWLSGDDSPIALPDDERAFQRLLDRADRNAFRELERKVAQLDVTHPGAPPRAMVLVDRETPYDPYVFLRGNPGGRGPEVPRRFLKVLSGPDRQPFGEGSGRLDLARAIASPDNPLTARVLVNRVWMHHFGQALVSTPSDFGFRSDPPTHPELLDWLAATFIEDGWSIKSLHRRIVLSQAYRQESLDRPDCLAVDPENALLWKQNRQRLELEPLRDAMLAVAGRLDTTMGGRSVDITDAPFSTRRTVYAFIDRQNLPGLFRTFDLASPNASSAQRYETTVPQQALFLMNSPFVAEQARHLADRLEREVSEAPDRRVQALYAWLFGREAGADEVELAARFVASHEASETEIDPGWRYGFGRFDPEGARTAAFTPFPHWSGDSWQFGDEVPHPEFAYLHLKADGGHVGQGDDHAVILRWVAPHDAVIAVEGALGHDNEQGDGVRGRVVAGRGGLLGEWVAHDGTAELRVDRYEVAAGETIDFLVDGRSGDAFDSFQWSPVIRVVEGPSAEAFVSTWSAKDDFHGPLPPRLGPWEQLVQVLLLTNEFAFVD